MREVDLCKESVWVVMYALSWRRIVIHSVIVHEVRWPAWYIMRSRVDLGIYALQYLNRPCFVVIG